MRTNNRRDSHLDRFVGGGLRENDYELAWGCSRREALYSTPYEKEWWNPDDYENNQQY